MIRINALTIATGLMISLLSACYYDKEDLLYGDLQCDTTNVSFSQEILPIIQNSCAITGCHVQGGSGNGIFENYIQIKSKVDNGSFAQRVLVQQDMPPSGSLSNCQIEHLMQWINDGALNN